MRQNHAHQRCNPMVLGGGILVYFLFALVNLARKAFVLTALLFSEGRLVHLGHADARCGL